MTTRAALIVLFSSVLLLAICYATAFVAGGPFPFVPWIFALGTAGSLTSFLVLGAARKGRLRDGRVKIIFIILFIILVAGFGLALRAPAVSADARLVLGLPVGAAIIIFVVGFVPVFLMPVVYAVTFDESTLSEAELEDLRRRLHGRDR